MITSLQNPQVKHWTKLRHNRDYRYDTKSVLVEGKNTITELSRKETPLTLITVHEDLCPAHHSSTQVVLVSEQVMKKITEVEESEGIVAEMRMPEWDTLINKKWIIALDGVSDPGNVGTLIRTSLALGWEGVFLNPTACDPYNDKALRAAKGATFQQALRMGEMEEIFQFASQNNIPILAADMKGETPQKDISSGAILVLGSESHGISEKVFKSTKRISIPMTNEMESLNVAIAGGILMYILKKSAS